MLDSRACLRVMALAALYSLGSLPARRWTWGGRCRDGCCPQQRNVRLETMATVWPVTQREALPLLCRAAPAGGRAEDAPYGGVTAERHARSKTRPAWVNRSAVWRGCQREEQDGSHDHDSHPAQRRNEGCRLRVRP